MTHPFSQPQLINICKCGCGKETKPGNRFILGHHTNRNKKGPDSPNWKGGRRKEDGYVLIYCPEHPCSRKDGYILEHRIIMEQYLGRQLEPEEVSHHINEVKDNNTIENLELCLRIIHRKYHRLGKQHTQETKLTISRKKIGNPANRHRLGKRNSKESNEKNRISHLGMHSGEKNPFYGKHHSKETKELLRKAAKQQWERKRREND